MMMSRVRHVVVNAINGNDEPRGPDRYLLEVMSQMAPQQPECKFDLCVAPWQQALRSVRLGPNVRVVGFSPPRAPIARVLWHAGSFARWADRQKADAIFLPNVIFAPTARTPMLMTVHDMAHFRFPEKFGPVKGRLQQIQIRLSLRRPKRLIAVSRFTREDIARFAGIDDERVVEIPEGGPEAVVRNGRPSGPPMLLYVGRTEHSKNVEALVDAFASSTALLEQGARLVIAGSPGNAEEAVSRRIRAANTPRIERIGFVPDEELHRLYRSATAFVFPSVVEGFGLVLLEAMAFGAPVVAMNASAVPGVVGDAALLVEPNDLSLLQRALERVVADETLQTELTRRGYQRIALFSWAETARQTWSQLEQIVQCPTPS